MKTTLILFVAVMLIVSALPVLADQTIIAPVVNVLPTIADRHYSDRDITFLNSVPCSDGLRGRVEQLLRINAIHIPASGVYDIKNDGFWRAHYDAIYQSITVPKEVKITIPSPPAPAPVPNPTPITQTITTMVSYQFMPQGQFPNALLTPNVNYQQSGGVWIQTPDWFSRRSGGDVNIWNQANGGAGGNGYGAAAAAAAAASTSAAVTPTSGAAAHQGSGSSGAAGGGPSGTNNLAPL